jgi:acetoin utilization deacetylase AcuC-like enzyme
MDSDEDKDKAGDSPLRELHRTFKRSMSIEGSPLITSAKKMDLNKTPNSSFRKMSFEYTDILSTIDEINKISATEGTVLVISAETDSHHVHNTGSHQENAARTSLLSGDQGCLRRKELQSNIKWIPSLLVQEAPLADILRIHEYSYIKHLENKCFETQPAFKPLSRSSNVVSPVTRNNINPPSPPPIYLPGSMSMPTNLHNIENLKDHPSFYAPDGMLDPDTPLSPYSLEAAKKYCGAAMLAVDLLMKPEETSRAAFVIGRPPGHHAGPNGCVPSDYFWKIPQMTSSGFCLLNTTAVAAGYARYKYSDGPRGPPRIAIVDIGNFTFSSHQDVSNISTQTFIMVMEQRKSSRTYALT